MTDISKAEVLERVRNEISRLTKMVEALSPPPMWSGTAIAMWRYDLKFYQAIESLLTAPTDERREKLREWLRNDVQEGHGISHALGKELLALLDAALANRKKSQIPSVAGELIDREYAEDEVYPSLQSEQPGQSEGQEENKSMKDSTAKEIICCRCGQETLFYTIAPYGSKDDGDPICAKCLDKPAPPQPSEEERRKLADFFDDLYDTAMGHHATPRVGENYSKIRALILSAPAMPRVTRLDLNDLLTMLIDCGPLWYRGKMPEDGKSVEIISDWLRDLGIAVEGGGE